MKVADSNGDKSRNREVLVKVANTNHPDMSRCLRQSPRQTHLCCSKVALILSETLALYKSFTYLLTYLLGTQCISKPVNLQGF